MSSEALWIRWSKIKAEFLAEVRSLHVSRIADDDNISRAGRFLQARLEAASSAADYPSLHDLVRLLRVRRPACTNIRDEDDSIIEGGELRRRAYSIYQRRFSREPSDPIAAADAEIAAAIRRLPLGRAPGWDDLPCEFLIAYEDFLVEALRRVFEASKLRGDLLSSIRRSTICLLPKSNGGPGLSAYRPISLPTADYRVLGNILLQRLWLHLPVLVPRCQTYAVPGRSPSWNVARIADEIHMAKKNGSELAVISTDLESAFDTLNRSFLVSLMVSSQLPPAFIEWFLLLYAGADAAGCAVSAALFSLATGPLLVRLERALGPRNVLAYADDIVLLIRRDELFDVVRNIFVDFRRASGIDVNFAKSRGLWCGAWQVRSDAQLGISWTSEQFQGAITRWVPFTRGLSLVGRARAANYLVLSTVVHHLHGYLPTDSTIAKLNARLSPWAAFTIIQWPPDLQSWIFGHDLEDNALAIMTSAKTRIYKYFLALELRGVQEDSLLADLVEQGKQLPMEEQDDGFTLVNHERKRPSNTAAERKSKRGRVQPAATKPTVPPPANKNRVQRCTKTLHKQANFRAKSAAGQVDQCVYLEFSPEFSQALYFMALEAKLGNGCVYQLSKMEGHILVCLSSLQLSERLIEEDLDMKRPLCEPFLQGKRLHGSPWATCPSITLHDGVRLSQIPARLDIKTKGVITPVNATKVISLDEDRDLCHGYSAVVVPLTTTVGSGLACVLAPGVVIHWQQILWPGKMAVIDLTVREVSMTCVNAHVSQAPEESFSLLHIIVALAREEGAWILGDLNISEESAKDLASGSAEPLAELLDQADLVDVATFFDAALEHTRVATIDQGRSGRGDKITHACLGRSLRARRRSSSTSTDNDGNAISGGQLRQSIADFLDEMTPMEFDEWDELFLVEISHDQIAAVIHLLPNVRVSGWDGLPCEFVKAFEELFTEVLWQVFKASRLRGALPPSSRRSKPTNDHYRVLSGVLMARLRSHLPNLVPDCQTYAVPGRSSSWNIARVSEEAAGASIHNTSPPIISLDLKSAFDTLSRSYQFALLEKLGCNLPSKGGLLSSTGSRRLHPGRRCINEGLLASQRGEAGLPSQRRAPQHWSWATATPPREDPGSVVAYADDIVLFIRDAQFELVPLIFEEFRMASGVAVNFSKSCELWCGSWKHRTDSTLGISWTSELLTVLGCPITTRNTVSSQASYLMRLLERIIASLARLARFVCGTSRVSWLPGRILARPGSDGGVGLLDIAGQLRLACLKGVQASLRGAANGNSWLRLLNLWEAASSILGLDQRVLHSAILRSPRLRDDNRFLRAARPAGSRGLATGDCRGLLQWRLCPSALNAGRAPGRAASGDLLLTSPAGKRQLQLSCGWTPTVDVPRSIPWADLRRNCFSGHDADVALRLAFYALPHPASRRTLYAAYGSSDGSLTHSYWSCRATWFFGVGLHPEAMKITSVVKATIYKYQLGLEVGNANQYIDLPTLWENTLQTIGGGVFPVVGATKEDYFTNFEQYLKDVMRGLAVPRIEQDIIAPIDSSCATSTFLHRLEQADKIHRRILALPRQPASTMSHGNHRKK
ncbi:hypothetical protein LAZ67_14001968 [Cordylochernes scorpioides]|uniref:Reverse transcriptase domain-containing protein n=1 Tax=Cordylochernes scorpioides TaxID=51811 RepID=A0ABY6L7J9_9ARAC|nr:hypothetical protein LAZ67_14001968 [Cordylochernes scorpioides]